VSILSVIDSIANSPASDAALDAMACLKLDDMLKVRLAQKSIDVGATIPEAWYTFNTKLGEPACTKPAADGSEVIWKASDCTWYAAGKFQGYYPWHQQV
jgi:hypothetical protein